MIEKKEVLKIADLSMLDIEDAKIDKFQEEFSSILNYIDELKEIDTEGISEMSHTIDLVNVERGDKIVDYKDSNLIKKEKNDYLVVKKVL